MPKAPSVIQYRISRPAVRRSGTVIIVQRPVPFALALPTPPAPKPPMVNQTVSFRRTAVPTLQRPRTGIIPPPHHFQTRPPPNFRTSVINVARRSSALSQVARDRDHMFQTYRPVIAALKGIGHGRILVIVGNGPSHTEAPLERLKGNSRIDLMSINKPDKRIWPTKYWCFVDQNQLDRHRELWNSFTGTPINSGSVRDRRPGQIIARHIAGTGFSKDLQAGFYIGRSSVYSAMQIAYFMDFAKVYIFGCDMTAVNGKLYPWGANPDVDDRNRKARFEKEADSYMYAAKHLNEMERSRYVFCSTYNPWPFMQSFARLDQKTAVDTILETASHL